MMQPGPPWPREGSAAPGEKGGRASHRAHPAQSGVPGRKALHLCLGLVSPTGAGSGPAPFFESLLRLPAPCLGPKLALSATPKRAGCESQVRAAASALRPRHRQAGRSGSSWLGEGEGQARGGNPRGGRRLHPLRKFAESFQTRASWGLNGSGKPGAASGGGRPRKDSTIRVSERCPSTYSRCGRPRLTVTVGWRPFPHFAAVRGEGRFL